MSDPVRYFFDNHLPNVVARELRRRGVDVQTAHAAGRRRTADPDILRQATVDGRAVVTEDRDYIALAADFQARGEPFAGVVFCDHLTYVNRPGLLLQALLILHGVYTADDMRDRLEYL